MSVLRHGGSLLQRSLSKLYSDTKQSYESVTKASKASEDPDLVELNLNFRTQKDRLLAWGLEWSDSSTTPSHDLDIDESLKRAGLGEIVTNIMSTIQNLLDEAQKLQKPQSISSPLPEKRAQQSLSPQHAQVKTEWTDAEVSRLNELLVQLTACIDTLCELSSSRRSMNSSSKIPKPLRELSSADHQQPMRGYHALNASKGHGFDFGNPISPQNEDVEQFLIQSNAAIHPLYLDRNSLDLASGEVAHAFNPPPYEVVAASSTTRLVGSVRSAAVPAEYRSTLDTDQNGWMPVLVEFTPAFSFKTAAILPPHKRLENLAKKLNELIPRARTSHIGFLQFLGYFIDLACSQYAFVYRLPERPGYQLPRDIGIAYRPPKTLFSVLPSDDGIMDAPVPPLEDRYRLAYNLVIAVLQLRDRELVHGNVNSSNIVFLNKSDSLATRQDKVAEDIRNPYFISFGQLSDDGTRPSPEPLSTSVYRHPQDRRSIDDSSAWAYDLYSLGLVLLEIGLWTPLNRLWKSKYDQTVFKSRIENVYAKKLASKCGTAYMNVVRTCLAGPESFLDSLNHPVNFGKGLAFAREYVFSIATDISRCCAIDVFGPPAGPDLETFTIDEPAASNDRQGSETGTVVPPNQPSRNTSSGANSSINPPPAVSRLQDVAAPPASEQPKAKRSALKKFNHLELPQNCLDDWNAILMPRLSKLLQKVLKDSTESSSASLMMVGETAESVKPTICVTCSSVGKVRGALRRYLDYEREVWGLIVIRGDITRSKVPRKKKRRTRKPRSEVASSPQDLNPYYQSKPACGASIGAYRYGEHYPPVSFGGVVMIDGRPFGMTVHHMLDAPSDCEEFEENEECDIVQRCAAPWDQEATMISQDVTYSGSWDADIGAPLTLEISDDEDDEEASLFGSGLYDAEYDGYADEQDEGEDEDDDASFGDITGVHPDDEEKLIVTQPALDDVEDGFYPNIADRTEEHLCFALGSIFASSGIRRQKCRKSGVKHEIDWALIDMNNDRLDSRNVVPEHSTTLSGRAAVWANPQPEKNPENAKEPTLGKVATVEELGGLEIACCGRTSGLRKGRISKAMTLVRMNGRRSFSHSWCVDGGFGIPGDSGAWIYDAKTGRLCGHVLAWSSQSQTAFMAPMQVMFDDIRETLGAENILLPDLEGDLFQSRSRNLSLVGRETQRQASSQATLPLDLSRLSIGGTNPDSRRGSKVPKDVPTAYRRRSSVMIPSPGREAQTV